ncbi:EAL domain-containing protein [Komagataeibacter europaeus]|uniref:EAL domain-containing protein n=1 Tax=Komagataeibacter europaeus TaxID=33995 RepID=UPI00031AB10E|nr:EAL domain-containing protein [Komagataeibacter europaeus]GBQ43462.1 c-di-GMP phosphodiesterase A [Komagataeibacter europaeus LMG 18890]
MSLLHDATEAIVVINEKNDVIFFNTGAEKLWGYTQDEVLGHNVRMLVPDFARQGHDGYITRNRETDINVIVGTSREIIFENRHGDYITGELTLSSSPIGPKGEKYYLASIKAVTEENHRKKLLDLQNTVFQSLSTEMQIQDVADLICREVENFVPDTVAILVLIDEEHRLRVLSGPGLPRRYAAALENVTLSDADIMALSNDLDEAATVVWDSYKSLGVSLGLHNCWASAIKAGSGKISGIFALFSRNLNKVSDWPRKIVAGCVPFCSVLIEQYDARHHISQLANYDPLTGFLNRTAIHKVLKTQEGKPGDNHFAVLMLNLDRFRDINDALGHANGDDFLKAVAIRIKSLCRSHYILSRAGGDEFVIILPDTRAANATAFAETLIAGMEEPIEIGGNFLAASVSVGISMFPENGPDSESLIGHAEAAMRLAKKEARGTFRVATPEDHAAAQDRLVLGSALRESLAKGLLNLHYQPQIEAKTGGLYGVEALSRWHHPHLGNIFPSRFIAVAEDTGQIEAIGAWCLEEACRQIVAWDHDGVVIPAVSVNLSAGHFRKRQLPEMISNLLTRFGIAPTRLTVEITESVMMDENKDTMDVLHAIRNLNVGLSMDDFGTGYSSLSRLTRLPLTEIKIDRSFIMNLEHDANAQAVTTAVIGIGNRLGMTVVTEGVETEAQYELLESLHCDVMQGYLFAKPMAPRDLETWFRQPRKIMPAMRKALSKKQSSGQAKSK